VYGYDKTPLEVARISVGISACARNVYEISVLNRLMCHPRMNAVWKTAPAVGGAASADGPIYAQQRACGKMLSFAFSTICNPVPVSKWSEVEEYRKKVLADTAKYRQVADDLAANGLVDPAADGGAAALLRLAQAKEEEARRTLAQTRTRDDPLGSRRFNHICDPPARIVRRTLIRDCRDPCRGRIGREGRQASGPIRVQENSP
jgi:hypothetical protein